MSMVALVVSVLLVVAFVLAWQRRSRARPGPPRASLPAALQASASPLDEDVQFTVYRPQQIAEDRWYPLLAFAHRSDRPAEDPAAAHPIEEVRKQAVTLLGAQLAGYRHVTTDSTRAIPRAGELSLVPEMEGVQFNPERAVFRWQQSVHRADFQIKATPGLVPRTARGQLTVFCGPFIVADIPLSIEVRDIVENIDIQKAGESRRYRQIFASYSHDDREIVEQFEAFAESFGDRYLRDVRALRAGQVWSDAIRDLIERADVFQLFWSWNALSSQYVKQEWEFALGLQRSGFVRPVYWEDPLPSTADSPPAPLRQLHFHKIKSTFLRYTNRAPVTNRTRRLSSAAAIAAALLALVFVPIYLTNRQPDVETSPPPTASPTTGTSPVSPSLTESGVDHVYFASGQSQLTDEARRTLEAVIERMAEDPRQRVVVESHLAITGTIEHAALAERRATVVRDYLVSRGIESSRLQIVSSGEARPDGGKTSQGSRPSEGRVSLRVQSPGQE